MFRTGVVLASAFSLLTIAFFAPFASADESVTCVYHAADPCVVDIEAGQSFAVATDDAVTGAAPIEYCTDDGCDVSCGNLVVADARAGTLYIGDVVATVNADLGTCAGVVGTATVTFY